MIARNTHELTEDDLWQTYAACRSRRLREELIRRYTPLAMTAPRQILGHRDEDLEQVALLGLIKAVDRYEPARGHRFASFAMPTILGEVKRHLRDQSRLVRCPRFLHDLRHTVKAKVRELTKTSGTAPSLSQVAAALDTGLDQVVEAMAMEEACHPLSLDATVTHHEGDSPTTLEESLGADDPDLERMEDAIAWKQVIERLDPELRKVIEMRYYKHLSQQEAGQQLGVSQMQVSRLERRALDRLRGQLAMAA